MAEEKRPELIPDDVKKVIRDTFLKQLKEPVLIEVYTKQGENDQYNEATVALTKTFSELSDKVTISFYTVGDDQAKKRNVLRSPTLLIAPDKYRIRYTGSPLGEEGRSFLVALMMASTGMSILTAPAMAKIAAIKDKRDIQVFVTPTCPYCPQQALAAMSAAVVNPAAISADVVEIFENQDLAEALGSLAVPQTFINGIFTGAGLQPEEIFVESLLTLKEPAYLSEEITPGEPVEKDLVIIGGGPAGLTAAIYAVRAGLNSILIEKSNLGGQVAITPVVENYPGFMRIGGKSLVDLIVQQAAQYADIHLGEAVKEIAHEGNRLQVKTNRALYIAKGVIVATGVDSKALNVPGERRLYGRGVSYCSTCDGYFFKDGKKVIVVGGGNTAAADALYLHNLGANVTLVHRRDSLRTEARLRESLDQSRIPVLWSSEVKEILGDKLVKSIKIQDMKTGAVKELPTDGVFVAIGYVPKNEIAKSLGLPLDEEGYIKADLNMRTSIPMVYAAGDITGGAKQIVVAVAQGSVAAMSAFEDITSPYWVAKEKELAKKV
ncbi:MAG TPA: FAD-dependent oxidoreductase [Nitrospirota bacterium]|nr:FAD-dependent oxidoreductase [Nitrospirota bacterium]